MVIHQYDYHLSNLHIVHVYICDFSVLSVHVIILSCMRILRTLLMLYVYHCMSIALSFAPLRSFIFTSAVQCTISGDNWAVDEQILYLPDTFTFTLNLNIYYPLIPF